MGNPDNHQEDSLEGNAQSLKDFSNIIHINSTRNTKYLQ